MGRGRPTGKEAETLSGDHESKSGGVWDELWAEGLARGAEVCLRCQKEECQSGGRGHSQYKAQRLERSSVVLGSQFWSSCTETCIVSYLAQKQKIPREEDFGVEL